MAPPPGAVYAAKPPGEEEPPERRDRLSVHLVWEGILAVVAIVLVVAVITTVSSRAFTSVLEQAGFIGLVAAGFALSLRTGTPNLAVGSIAAFTGGFTSYLMAEDLSAGAAMAVAVVLATVAGVIAGVVVGALSVPAWAATLGAALILEAVILSIRRLPFGRSELPDYSTGLWVGLFVVVSVGGGALWLLPSVRSALSATRQAGEPGQWGGLRPGLGALVGIAGSSLLAGLAGIAQLTRIRFAEPTSGQFLTAMALAAVLIGGVSVFGRRAGVAGTALGVLVVVSAYTLVIINVRERWAPNVFIGVMIVLGLVVSRGLESIITKLNTPRPAPPPGPAPPPQPGSLFIPGGPPG